MNTSMTLLTALGAVFLIHQAQGSILAVGFGGSYSDSSINSAQGAGVTGTVDADFDGNADDSAYYIPFGTVFTSPNSESWTTPPGASGGPILHGVSVANLDSATTPGAILDRYNSSTDSIQITGGNGASGAQHRFASAVYWEKTSFLNGADAASALSFADSSTGISIDFINSGTPAAGGLRAGRALAQNGSTWYVSHDIFGGTTGTLEFNPSSSDWYVLDTSSGTIFLDTDNLGTAVSGDSFTDINALGIYTQHTLLDGAASGHIGIHAFSGFDATVVAVPEPSAYALLLGFFGLGAVLFRRRK